MMTAAEIARSLADRIEALVVELLPAGRREGREWRCGSVAGEAGSSLGVRLAGDRRGIWCDFAAGEAGDALDLVRATLGLDTGAAMTWSRRWLGVAPDDRADLPRRPLPLPVAPEPEPDRWRRTWRAARPISGTLAETYLAARGLRFDDPAGRVLRFAARRARRSPITDEIEHHPALLALLRDVRIGVPCGLVNIYLLPDGSDRLRDKKGKTSTGRAVGAAVMLDPWDAPTMGLVICEGVETGIALHAADLRPVWALGGAGNLTWLPVLAGIEALTIAADRGEVGMQAAEACAERWRGAGCEVSIVAAPVDDWATPL